MLSQIVLISIWLLRYFLLTQLIDFGIDSLEEVCLLKQSFNSDLA